MENLSFLNNADPQAIEDLYNQYLTDPSSVEYGWRRFFEGFEFSKTDFTAKNQELFGEEFKVINLINAYRQRGHLFTKTNPVRTRRKYTPTLDIENFGLTPNDLEKPFHAGKEIGIGTATLSKIIAHLHQTYCEAVGVEFAYIRKPEIDAWLKESMEGQLNTPHFDVERKTHILDKLNEAVLFEQFIHKKYPGQKSFSLEGAEALIPALDAIIEKGASLGCSEFIMGMPHRGRLNVLANILQKSYSNIFSEFEGIKYNEESVLGDVKYHLGYTSLRKTKKDKEVRLTLSPNPSHLEAVNPVVMGITRSRSENTTAENKPHAIPILIHGDASVAGQGIIYEILQMSELPAHRIGGTIHLVVNNQIGFTTNYLEARSSVYCTDIAKIIQSPIFHINGDDVEAVVYAVELAMEFREKFNKDIFIDLLCYRRYGHNESDEPRFTQPLLYKIIEKHPNPLAVYVQKLINEASIEQQQADALAKQFNQELEEALTHAKTISIAEITSFLAQEWKGFIKTKDDDVFVKAETAIDEATFFVIAEGLTKLPANKTFFRKISKLQQDRHDMVFKNDAIDWAMAELMAFGSLISENYPVRLCGQDVERGTFSQRHSVFRIEESEEKFIPLNHLSDHQSSFNVHNSLLSEYGVLGFEYGYSLASPNTLTLWEAQFGDFANGAQIIFDQFISSGEEKWNVFSGLVMLLPHGFEGQGPEHSSARMERFLELCAHHNIQVANCTTPANYFHLLRRQMKRNFRKPLIVFTPKSLLRYPHCVSKISDFTSASFQEVIDDVLVEKDKVSKIVFCTGKIYYELLEERKTTQQMHVALIRIEQLYPFPQLILKAILAQYKNASEWLWVQEEPGNTGAWNYINRHFRDVKLRVIARPDSGSPAGGSGKLHKLRQRKIIEKTFDKCQCENIKAECFMLCSQQDY